MQKTNRSMPLVIMKLAWTGTDGKLYTNLPHCERLYYRRFFLFLPENKPVDGQTRHPPNYENVKQTKHGHPPCCTGSRSHHELENLEAAKQQGTHASAYWWGGGGGGGTWENAQWNSLICKSKGSWENKNIWNIKCNFRART